MSRRVMGDLWLGHFTADLASGALPAVLVFLKPLLHLSYTKTGAVVLAATITSALAQPLFGRWSDRHVMTWLLPVGIAAAAIGVSHLRRRCIATPSFSCWSPSLGSESGRFTRRR